MRCSSGIWFLCGVLLCIFGCGKIPLLSENRKDFAPWEKLPEGKGIHYVEKFSHAPGTDPFYLAKMRYDDDAALQTVIATFGLVPHQGPDEPSTFTRLLSPAPPWFPLKNVTDVYIFPAGQHEFVSNLWLDKKAKTMILERTWW